MDQADNLRLRIVGRESVPVPEPVPEALRIIAVIALMLPTSRARVKALFRRASLGVLPLYFRSA